LVLQTSGGTIRDGSVINTGTAMTVSVGGLLQEGTGSRELRIDLDAGTVYQAGGVTAPEGWTIQYSINNGTSWVNTEPSPASGVTNVRATNASVVAGPTDGSSQLYTRAVTSNIPASTFGASTGGDGWDVFFYDNYVLNIFHHSSTEVALDCHLRSAVRIGGTDYAGGARCPGFDPNDASKSRFNGYMAANRSGGWVNGTTGKMYAFTANNVSGNANRYKPGVLCVNLDVSPPTACGFTALSSDTNVNGYDYLSNAEGVGGRLFGLETRNNKLLCFDPATNAACAGSPISLNASGTNQTGYFHVVPLGTKVFATTNTTLYCFESSSLAACAGAWPVTYSSLSWTAPQMPPVAHMDATGVINGVCLSPGCIDLLGAKRTGVGWVNPFSVTPWGTGDQGYGYYGRFEATAGRAYMAEILSSAGVYCFDYATEAACAGWDDTPFTGSLGSSLYALRADPTNPNCIFWNSDPGNIGLFSAVDGATSCAANPIITMQPSQFAPRFVCTTSGGIDRWKSITLTAVNGGTAASQTLTIRKANGDAIAGWTNVPMTVNTAKDLSSLAVSESGSRPTFNVAFTGVTGSLTSAEFSIIYEGRGPELCVNAVLSNAAVSGSPACPVVQSIVGKMTENVVSAATGTAISRSFTISGDATQCPENIRYAGPPGKPTDVACVTTSTGATVTYKAPSDNGGANIRWYEVSFDGGTTWKVMSTTSTGSTYSAAVTASTTGATNCQVRAVNVLGVSVVETANLTDPPPTTTASTTTSTTTTTTTTIAATTTTIAATTTTVAKSIDATAKGNSAVVKFTPTAPKDSIKSYEYSLDGGKTWKKATVSTAADGRLVFSVDGLEEGSAYTVAIRAVTKSGTKVSEGKAKFTTKSALPATGSDPVNGWISGGLLLLVGVMLLAARRRVIRR
jgi:LPXTG-motif cell wall-anchored protein